MTFEYAKRIERMNRILPWRNKKFYIEDVAMPLVRSICVLNNAPDER